MRLRAALQLLAGLALGLLLALATRRWLSPFAWLPDDRLRVLVVSGCGGSRLAAQEFAGPDLREHFLVIPLEDPSEPFAREVCARLLPELRFAPLRLVPEDVACRWLAEDARATITHGYGSPIFAEGRALVPLGDEAAAFARHGLSYAPTLSTYGVRVLDGG